MTLANRLAFAHALRELMDRHHARFIYDEFPTASFLLDGDELDHKFYTQENYFHITYDEDNREGDWEVDGGFKWQISRNICDKVLDGKIKFIDEPTPSIENRPMIWAPPQMRSVLFYRIDKNNVGKWIVRGWAYDIKGQEEGRYGSSITKDFELSDEAFYELLAEAERQETD